MATQLASTALLERKRPALGSWVLTDEGWKRVARALNLSARELDVLHGLFDDERAAATAERLGLSPHTINTYLRRLYRKLDVSSRSSAVLRVFTVYVGLEDARSRSGRSQPEA